MDTRALYSSSPKDPYYYWKGINWRAYVAYIAGIVINVVGFAGQCGATIPDSAEKMYQLNFFLGLIVAGGVYYGLCKLSPVPACGDTWPSEVDNDAMLGEMAATDDEWEEKPYEPNLKKGPSASSIGI